uniref:Uncharacterized protein n=1 Tax=Strombidium inclinatum TaxID=197538 RepID=A0A7S3N108_9SPIT|mmetsp:Transcript_36935/g.56560  ORF Transcript_36935/g.56560 Transcript_36935/m.56560 type:complete len:151 (+) Transcript_36935:1092-1544(+)
MVPRMSKTTQNKLLNLLNQFSHPGGPFFPPRELRQIALQASGELFPEGQSERMLTHNIFRVVHPWYLTKSFVFHSLRYVNQGAEIIRSMCGRRPIENDEDEETFEIIEQEPEQNGTRSRGLSLDFGEEKTDKKEELERENGQSEGHLKEE